MRGSITLGHRGRTETNDDPPGTDLHHGEPPGVKLTVYVPAHDTDLRREIDPASGVVGSPYRESGRLRIDFESNRLGLDEFAGFADRVQRAAERHRWNNSEGYPTSACAYVDPEMVVEVGEFDTRDGRVRVIREDELADWLGLDAVPEEELVVRTKG